MKWPWPWPWPWGRADADEFVEPLVADNGTVDSPRAIGGAPSDTVPGGGGAPSDTARPATLDPSGTNLPPSSEVAFDTVADEPDADREPAEAEPVAQAPSGVRVCMDCGTLLETWRRECPGCGSGRRVARHTRREGTAPATGIKTCRSCGTTVLADARRCTACGGQWNSHGEFVWPPSDAEIREEVGEARRREEREESDDGLGTVLGIGCMGLDALTCCFSLALLGLASVAAIAAAAVGTRRGRA